MEHKKRHTADAAEFDLHIDKLIYGGEGLGRHKGKVVFVPFTAPGDFVRVRVVENKKKYVRAEIKEVLSAGDGRIQPPCPYFLSCGGCQWQHLEYGAQIEAKRKILEELFSHRFPETRNLSIEMKASPRAYGYRSRARVQARSTGNRIRVGFYRYRSHEVEDIGMCPLLIAPLNQTLTELRSTCTTDYESADREWELAGDEAGLGVFAEAAAGADARGETTPTLLKQVGEFGFATTPAVFFQANDLMLQELTATALQDAPGGASALDLYAGVGFFSLPLARRYQTVVSVESQLQAHRCCIDNANRARLANITAVCADVHEWTAAVASVSSPAFSLVLLDPPRSGAEPETMRRIVEWAPERIVYVSCDPQTLVRDLEAVPSRDYRIGRITGLDLFPQTYHFETVATLIRRK